MGLLLDAGHGGGARGLDEDGVDGVAPAEDAGHEAGVGHDDGVVLVLAEDVVALAREHAEDAKRHAPDAERLADGIDLGEELAGDGGADDADLGGGAGLHVAEHAARGDVPRADAEEIGGFAVNGGAPVLAVAQDLPSLAEFGADGYDAEDLAADGVGVGDGEAVGAAHAAARAGSGGAAGEDGDDVASEGGDLGLDLGLGAVADADHGDDGAHADDDAQRGEEGAQLVAPQGA